MDVNRLRWQPQQGFKTGLIIVLATIAIVGLTPHWAAGQWPWSRPLEAPNIEQLRSLTETSLSLPGWETGGAEAVPINGRTWGLSEYTPASDDSNDNGERIGLLLSPQTWHDKQPTVEWVDLRGAQNWRIADATVLRFDAGSGMVRARYFQARTDHQTFAVLQWYAWPNGGDFAPNRWFWVDQLSQWRSGQRTPWVAVCLLLPIRPLGDIDTYQAAVNRLAQAVQADIADIAFKGAI